MSRPVPFPFAPENASLFEALKRTYDFDKVKGMKSLREKISLFAIIILIGSWLGIAFDDPDHLLQPDIDCPICKVINTQVTENLQAIIPLIVPDLIYPVRDVNSAPNTYLDFQCIYIRGPPFSV